MIKKTTDEIKFLCDKNGKPHILSEYCDVEWVRVKDIKENLNIIIEYIKQYCIKFHKIEETENCDCDRYILIILRHYDELSKSGCKE